MAERHHCQLTLVPSALYTGTHIIYITVLVRVRLYLHAPNKCTLSRNSNHVYVLSLRRTYRSYVYEYTFLNARDSLI